MSLRAHLENRDVQFVERKDLRLLKTIITHMRTKSHFGAFCAEPQLTFLQKPSSLLGWFLTCENAVANEKCRLTPKIVIKELFCAFTLYDSNKILERNAFKRGHLSQIPQIALAQSKIFGRHFEKGQCKYDKIDLIK